MRLGELGEFLAVGEAEMGPPNQNGSHVAECFLFGFRERERSWCGGAHSDEAFRLAVRLHRGVRVRLGDPLVDHLLVVWGQQHASAALLCRAKLTGMDLDHVPKLAGDGVRLRELRDSDIARRASLGRSREIARGFGEDLDCNEPMTQHDAADELGYRFGPGPHWVIADQHDVFVGVVRLAPIDTANRSARLGIGILDPDRLGQGLGTEATRLVLGWGFGHLDLHRVSLTVLADNTRAIAAYTRCGFVVEGRLRDTLLRDGKWHDDLSMAILKPQWAAQQADATTSAAGEP